MAQEVFKSPLAQAKGLVDRNSILERLNKIPEGDFKKLQWDINRKSNLGTEGDYTEETFPYYAPKDYLDSYDAQTIGLDSLDSYLKEKGW